MLPLMFLYSQGVRGKPDPSSSRAPDVEEPRDPGQQQQQQQQQQRAAGASGEGRRRGGQQH